MRHTSLHSASSHLRWHKHKGITLKLTKIPAHLPPAGMCLCIAELRSFLTWQCHALRSISINPPFTSAAFRQDMYSSSFLSPDWKSLKALLTWEAADEGIWRREMNFSTEKFCMTSRQKMTREIYKTEKETQLMQQSWNKNRITGKNLAWVGEVVSLGINNCGWISTLRNVFAGETETELSTVT